jgi:malonyl-CoA O-methyltransferase
MIYSTNSSIPQKSIQHSFSQACKTYDEAAHFQKKTAQTLFKRLPLLNKTLPISILDAGCGTGYCARYLSRHYSNANVKGIDLALGMIEYAKNKQRIEKQKKDFSWIDYQQGNVETLPYPDYSFDLVFSNLVFQWVKDPIHAFLEIQRVLKPKGHFIFSSLEEHTLHELKTSWMSVDSKKHVNNFLTYAQFQHQFQSIPFRTLKIFCEKTIIDYQNIKELMRDLKAIGAHNLDQQRAKGLLGKNKWNQLKKAYETFRNSQGYLPATYSVFYGYAQK